MESAKYGLNEHFQALALEYPTLRAGRVTGQEKGSYRVICEHSDGLAEIPAEVSGKFRHTAISSADFPAVGDFVVFDENEHGSAVIRHVLPRKSVFARKAAGTSRSEQIVAANVDILFICMSLNSDFNLRRLERYLSIAWDSGAAPVVILTKSDLCDDVEILTAKVRSVAAGADVLTVTAMEQDGFEAVSAYIRSGQTAAFTGSSGVGKSTLINRLIGYDRLDTNGLRNDDKGRHTTTHRELILLPTGGMVIDTPGMRELGIWNASEGLEVAFADIERLASICKFGDCTHKSEPGCAVRAAIKNGELTAERLRSYEKLRAENSFMFDNANAQSAKQRKFKEIAKYSKQLKKDRE